MVDVNDMDISKNLGGLYFSGSHFVVLNDVLDFNRSVPVDHVFALGNPYNISGVFAMDLETGTRYDLGSLGFLSEGLNGGKISLCGFEKIQEKVSLGEQKVNSGVLDEFYNYVASANGVTTCAITPDRYASLKGGVFIETDWEPSKEFPGVRTQAGLKRRLRQILPTYRLPNELGRFSLKLEEIDYYMSLYSVCPTPLRLNANGLSPLPSDAVNHFSSILIGGCNELTSDKRKHFAYLSRFSLCDYNGLEVLTAEDGTGKRVEDWTQERLDELYDIVIAESGHHIVIQRKDYSGSNLRARLIVYSRDDDTKVKYDF